MEFAVVTGRNTPLALSKAAIPQAPALGVRVKTAFAGICHTDVHFIKDETDLGGGQKAYRSENLIKQGYKFEGTVPGHEVAGIVDALGSDLDLEKCPFQVGDRVLVYPWFGCRKCVDCQHGFNNLCENNLSGSMDLGLGPNSGGYSTYVLVPEVRFLVKVPDSLGLDVASMLPCSGITAYWAILKAQPFLQQAGNIKGVARVLVNGAGGLGLWAISLLACIYKDRQDVEIYASDIGEDKLELAREKGAVHTVLLQKGASADDNAALLSGEDNVKFNAVLDFVGAESTVDVCIKVVSKWGALAVVGIAGGQLTYPLVRLTYNTLTVYGTRTGPLTLLPQLINLVSQKDFPRASMEYYSLSQVNEALDNLRQGKINGRAILKFD